MGPVTFFQLIQKFGTAAAALDALPSLPRRGVHLQPASLEEIQREIDQTNAFGAEVVCAFEDAFPRLLKQFSPPPPTLTVRGDESLAHRRCVAIVGARQASAAGRKMARTIAEQLAQAGFIIVSGLARGIDGEAHAASLDKGTIAVLGGGVDHVYPPQHARLYTEISKRGLIVSESPFGHRATAKDFPRRNRIITGMAEGVVVVEAAERSGSLISARTALEQNREVMSVPGSPLDPRSAGSNRLLRQGATLVRHADDVIEALSIATSQHVRAPVPPDFETSDIQHESIPESQVTAIETALSYTPVHIYELARATKLSPARCAAILVELELSGVAKTYAGGFASLALQA